MSDRRHKDVDWELHKDINAAGDVVGLTRRAVAVLMDIRSELRSLNGLLQCSNFLSIPGTLRRISRNTAKPRKRRTKA